MKSVSIQVIPINDSGDERGSSFSLPITWREFIGSVLDLHAMTLRPNQVRGNHYHVERRESIIVMYSDQWSLHWDSGPQSAIQHQHFVDKGAVLIQIDPYTSHAIRNDGSVDLYIIGISNRQYDAEDPDSHYRRLVSG
jgi:dTDP-4-dehydrorhamnose 3,5-epimerase-like enzyme